LLGEENARLAQALAGWQLSHSSAGDLEIITDITVSQPPKAYEGP
jgi:hypothetical protein